MLRKQPTDILEMLEEVTDRFSFQMHQKDIQPVLSVENDIPAVPLDRDQIDQVLDNVVSNALKYTLEGGTITIAARRSDEHALAISVSDTGMGIPQRDLDRIFERFYRVDKARSRSMGGTGLGLSIAREIVKAHDGSISLESEVDVGTTVTFTLPMREKGVSTVKERIKSLVLAASCCSQSGSELFSDLPFARRRGFHCDVRNELCEDGKYGSGTQY